MSLPANWATIAAQTPAPIAATVVQPALAAEIMFENDEWTCCAETPAKRFARMRKWITDQIESNRQRAEGEKS